MSKRITKQTVIRTMGKPHMELVPGNGYWYFVFDDSKRYDTHSVYVARINDLTLDIWTNEGNAFYEKCLELPFPSEDGPKVIKLSGRIF
jgi:outer membrane protein assembly factor BamE (lipoprotein component of BamABCDE complex)